MALLLLVLAALVLMAGTLVCKGLVADTTASLTSASLRVKNVEALPVCLLVTWLSSSLAKCIYKS